MDLRNKGIIRLHPTHSLRHRPVERTLIVSGVARSGTSMVARVLQGAGVFMGERLDDVVFEDHEFSLLFSDPNHGRLEVDALLRKRDRRHRVWGFKRPHLHVEAEPVVELCRNPFVILTVRDPVAIAERNAISEHRNSADSLGEAITDLQAMLHYARSLTCPVLFVSYEKAVLQPEQFVDRLLEFCGLEVPLDARERLLALVEPDRPEYLEAARRVFEGYVDGFNGTALVGWARQRDLHLPVHVTLFRDSVSVRNAYADEYRPDLLQAGMSSGNHGFSIELADLGFTAASRITVRIEGRLFVLNNSGSTIRELGGDLERLGIRASETDDPVDAMAVHDEWKASLLP